MYIYRCIHKIRPGQEKKKAEKSHICRIYKIKIGHTCICSTLLFIILLYSHGGYELFIFKHNRKTLVLFNGQVGFSNERLVSDLL